jgi:hypothetical protein
MSKYAVVRNPSTGALGNCDDALEFGLERAIGVPFGHGACGLCTGFAQTVHAEDRTTPWLGHFFNRAFLRPGTGNTQQKKRTRSVVFGIT